MAEEKTTHAVAESTDEQGAKHRTETTRTTTASETTDGQTEDKPQQVKPDGR